MYSSLEGKWRTPTGCSCCLRKSLPMEPDKLQSTGHARDLTELDPCVSPGLQHGPDVFGEQRCLWSKTFSWWSWIKMFQNSPVLHAALKARSCGMHSKHRTPGNFHQPTQPGFVSEVTQWSHWMRLLDYVHLRTILWPSLHRPIHIPRNCGHLNTLTCHSGHMYSYEFWNLVQVDNKHVYIAFNFQQDLAFML